MQIQNNQKNAKKRTKTIKIMNKLGTIINKIT